MSKTLAEQMADEWWFRVREYGKKNKDPFKSGHLADMIAMDLERSGPGMVDGRDIAQAAVEILKVMLAEHRRREARHGVQKPSA